MLNDFNNLSPSSQALICTVGAALGFVFFVVMMLTVPMLMLGLLVVFLILILLFGVYMVFKEDFEYKKRNRG